MKRHRLAAALALTAVLVGCHAESARRGVPDEPPPATTDCLAGELPLEGPNGNLTCLSAGIAICGPGFVTDGDGGCVAVLPDAPCPPGEMAIPGESSCRPVGDCGLDPWGDIPVDEATIFVDPSFEGVSDGTSAAPHKSISAAVAAAPSGALVAVAAGDYAESVVVANKPVVLWGRCPEMVSLQGDGAPGQQATVLVLGGADGTTVRDVAIRGAAYGVASSGSQDVTLERVWVHDVDDRGVVVEDTYGPSALTIRDSLVEEATGLGVFATGASLTVERTELRQTRPGAGSAGRAISVRGGSSLDVRASFLHDHHDQGILLSGSEGLVELSVIRDIRGVAGVAGGGITVQRDTTTLAPSAMTLVDVIVERSANYGILVEGSGATLERVVVRDTQPTPDAVDRGAGLQAQGHPTTGDPSTVSVRQSVFERNRYGGISVTSSDATVESTIVRDTAPLHDGGSFGRGALVFYDASLGLPASLELVGSVVSGNREAGISVAASRLKMARTAVVDTQPGQGGLFGRGVNVQSSDDGQVSSTVTIAESRIERSHEIGLYVEGSDAELVDSTVQQTLARPFDGLFGDGVHVGSAFVGGPAGLLQLQQSVVRDNARAGVVALGGIVKLSASVVSCNPIPLNGQANAAGDFAIEDLGGNDCSCDSEQACKVSGEDLAPPDPLGAGL